MKNRGYVLFAGIWFLLICGAVTYELTRERPYRSVDVNLIVDAGCRATQLRYDGRPAPVRKRPSGWTTTISTKPYVLFEANLNGRPFRRTLTMPSRVGDVHITCHPPDITVYTYF